MRAICWIGLALLGASLAGCGDGSLEQRIGATTEVRYDTGFSNLPTAKDRLSAHPGRHDTTKIPGAMGWAYERPLGGWHGRYRNVVWSLWEDSALAAYGRAHPKYDGGFGKIVRYTRIGMEIDCMPGFERMRVLSVATQGHGRSIGALLDSANRTMLDHYRHWQYPADSSDAKLVSSVCQ